MLRFFVPYFQENLVFQQCPTEIPCASPEMSDDFDNKLTEIPLISLLLCLFLSLSLSSYTTMSHCDELTCD